jgi:peptidoglycan/xylan/chitin deacetylase (PgdA/CDA1 family)
MLLAVNYHYVRPAFDAPHPGIHGVTPEQLERQLTLLGTLGRFVGADELAAAVDGRATLPERAFVVTFDDGLREQFDHAVPVLRRLGIPALFFVNTAPILRGTVSSVHKIHLTRAFNSPAAFRRMLEAHARELGIVLGTTSDEERTAAGHYAYDDPETARLKSLLAWALPLRDREALVERCFHETFGAGERACSEALYMNVEHIQELARDGCVGTHSHEHLPLGLLSLPEAREQLAASVSELERWTGRAPIAVSYPYGSNIACASWVADLARELGLVYGFTMERAGNADLRGPLQLARFACNDLPGGSSPRAPAEALFETVPVRQWGREARPARVA